MSVVERPEVDFDQFSDEFGENRHAEWAKMRQCPVAHNSRYGGFWVVSGYDEVVAVSRDGATFSSKYEEDSPDGIEYIGIMGVPRMPGVPSARQPQCQQASHCPAIRSPQDGHVQGRRLSEGRARAVASTARACLASRRRT